MPRTKHIINIHTATGTTAPVDANLFLGEIAVQHTPNDPGIWIKMGNSESSTEYEKFIGRTEITNLINDNKILGSGYTYSGIPYVNSATTFADAYSALTQEFLDSEEDCLTGVSLNGSAVTVNDRVAEIITSTIYAGTAEPSPTLGSNGDVYLQTNPVVLYETDGTTGLLGHNDSTFENHWQLTNLDFTPYKFIRCYFKASALNDATGYTPAVVVDVPLDEAAKGPTIYMGGQMVALPFNRNRQYLVSCAVDSTKTKFQVVHQNTIWDVTASDANNNGRYLYKIEGYI